MQDLRAILHDSWSRAVVAATSVEEHAQELVGRLPSLTPESAQTLLAQVADRLRNHREQLADQVQGAVQAGLSRLNVSSRADLQALEEKVAALEARLARLDSRERPAG